MAEKSSSPLFEGKAIIHLLLHFLFLFLKILELIILNSHITLVFAMQNSKDMTMLFCILSRL